MIRLTKALKAWASSDFEETLKEEIEQLNADMLPLQQGLSTGSYVVDNILGAMIISVAEERDFIQVKAGIFYTGIIAGCSCADDPTPFDEHNEYCVLQFEIDKQSAATSVVLLSE